MSGSLVLTGYYITEQSWLFLFNVGSGVHLRLAGQQWTGADFDWNNTIDSAVLSSTGFCGKDPRVIHFICLVSKEVQVLHSVVCCMNESEWVSEWAGECSCMCVYVCVSVHGCMWKLYLFSEKLTKNCKTTKAKSTHNKGHNNLNQNLKYIRSSQSFS